MRSFIKSTLKSISTRLTTTKQNSLINKSLAPGKYNYNEKSFDEIYLSKISKKNPIIFDGGAGDGLSIQRFKKTFPRSIIHSFEPLDKSYQLLEEHYKNKEDVILNYSGLGDKTNVQTFHKLRKYNASTFLDPNLKSNWFSRDFSNYSSVDYAKDNNTPEITEQQIQVITIDDYLKSNNIEFIDILKAKTQGSELRILNGAKSSITNNKIRFIELKIILSDWFKEKFTISDVENCLKFSNYKLIAINHFNTKTMFWIDLVYENFEIK